MARLKLLTQGRALWTRTIGSTVVGQAVDTVLVIVLTFAGTVPGKTLANMILTGYLLKVGYEVLATPLTYLAINALKRAEHSDPLDINETFNPFRLGLILNDSPRNKKGTRHSARNRPRLSPVFLSLQVP